MSMTSVLLPARSNRQCSQIQARILLFAKSMLLEWKKNWYPARTCTGCSKHWSDALM